MRIAIAAASFPQRIDEDPVFPASYELAKGLQGAGHDVLVMTFCNPANPEDTENEVDVAGIRVLRKKQKLNQYGTFMGLSRMQVFAWQAARARNLYEASAEDLKQFDPDVIECQEFNGLGFFFAAEQSVPLVVRCYGPMTLIARSGDIGDIPFADCELIEAMESSTVAAADGVVSICHDIASWWSERTGRSLADFEIIRAPMTVSDAILQSELKKEEQFPTLFFWGRVEKQKGADLLIECLPRVVAEFPSARLIIGGEETKGYNQTVPYAQTMRSRVKELGLERSVEFLGFLERKRIVALARSAHICVFPSRYETACYSAIEAMSYGSCVVATRVGGLPEYVVHGETGWLVEPDNANALADGIIHIAKSEKLRESIAFRGPYHVREFCSKEVAARQSTAAYQKAIESFRAGTSRKRAMAFRLLAEHFGRGLADLPSRQMHKSVQYDTGERSSDVYKSGFAIGYQQAVSDRSMSLGSAIYTLARKIKQAGGVKK